MVTILDPRLVGMSNQSISSILTPLLACFITPIPLSCRFREHNRRLINKSEAVYDLQSGDSSIASSPVPEPSSMTDERASVA